VIGASPFTDTNRQSNTVRPDCRFAALKGSTALASVSSELPASASRSTMMGRPASEIAVKTLFCVMFPS
jgi:hypothetical protein